MIIRTMNSKASSAVMHSSTTNHKFSSASVCFSSLPEMIGSRTSTVVLRTMRIATMASKTYRWGFSFISIMARLPLVPGDSTLPGGGGTAGTRFPRSRAEGALGLIPSWSSHDFLLFEMSPVRLCGSLSSPTVGAEWFRWDWPMPASGWLTADMFFMVASKLPSTPKWLWSLVNSTAEGQVTISGSSVLSEAKTAGSLPASRLKVASTADVISGKPRIFPSPRPPKRQSEDQSISCASGSVKTPLWWKAASV
mmetsp:Transcript_56153/g.133825  ORF Transcript_56153/g.133825 Transcript_56153/m.133825 type:complete len:252 (-) Transcript_56153:233-988(-)